MTKIAIIGGSGLENPNILKNPKRMEASTKYGNPSSDFITGEISGVEVAILSRHGREHTITPTGVNNRANIQAITNLGCTHILATTACGSLKEEINRGDLILLDQFIDFTRFRKNTFFDSFVPHKPQHAPMAEPFDREMRLVLTKVAENLGLNYHPKGTVVTIEGPRFSTIAESKMFRQWGADVINMSTAPECMLANEMGIPYAAIAMSTDYDCWKTDEEPVSWEAVLEVFQKNVTNVVKLIKESIPFIGK